MSSRRVYVIEDDPAVLRSTGILLQSLGYAFEGFADPEDFLNSIELLGPGRVITDLRMPGMNGFELRQALHERSINWPVILMTSDADSDLSKEAAASGFAGFLAKPFSASQLAAKLEACPVPRGPG